MLITKWILLLVLIPTTIFGADKVIYGDCFHGNGGWLIDDVTHWMPVPDKPGKVK